MKQTSYVLREMDHFPTAHTNVASSEPLSIRRHARITMDPQQNQSHDNRLSRTSSTNNRQDWRGYRTQGDTHEGRQHNWRVPHPSYYHYHQHQNYSYFYNPPYVRYQDQDSIMEHYSTSLEDSPSPPYQYHNTGFDPFFGRNGPGLSYYHDIGSGVPDPAACHGVTRPPQHHERAPAKRPASKPHSTSTLVTPIRPYTSDQQNTPESDDVGLSGRFVNEEKSPVKRDSKTRRSNVATPGVIWELGEYDVLCGRGAPTNYHGGNLFLRKLVDKYQTVYLCSKRSDKPAIAWKLLDIVTSHGGRFVRRNKAHKGSTNFGWEQLTDKQAYEKICQALREGAPELRRRMLQDMKGTRNRRVEVLLEDDNENTKNKERGLPSSDKRDVELEKPSPTEELVGDKEERSNVYPI
jgi:hypothetical protein